MLALNWACPLCTYRTTLPVDVCPNCHVPLGVPEGNPDARRTPRIPLRPAALCEINGRFEAAALDLSPLGAGLEHRDMLRRGERFLLRMVPRWLGGSLVLPSKVVWSKVHRMEMRRDDGELIFRSGVEFANLSAVVERDLVAYLGSLRGGRGGAVALVEPSFLN